MPTKRRPAAKTLPAATDSFWRSPLDRKTLPARFTHEPLVFRRTRMGPTLYRALNLPRGCSIEIYVRSYADDYGARVRTPLQGVAREGSTPGVALNRALGDLRRAVKDTGAALQATDQLLQQLAVK